MSNVVSLRFEGSLFRGWKAVTINESIESAARDFAFPFTRSQPGARNPIKLPLGKKCEIFIGDDLVFTGWTEGLQHEGSATASAWAATGRSLTCDLIDCSAAFEDEDPTSWRNRKLEQIASDLAAQFEVEVVAAADTGEAIPRFRLQPGEPAFAAIERAARLRAVLITDDAEGRLVLTRVGSGKAITPLTRPGNVLEVSATFSTVGLYSDYKCKGQSAGDDLNFGATIAAISGESEGVDLGRFRPLIITSESRATRKRCQVRAEWEASTRAGQSVDITYTVAGWRQADGSLWTPNESVDVRDEELGIDAEMLIVGVSRELTEGTGSRTKIKVAPKSAYELLPPVEKAKRRARKAKLDTATLAKVVDDAMFIGGEAGATAGVFEIGEEF
jgi:prophage tail gpP-like protein